MLCPSPIPPKKNKKAIDLSAKQNIKVFVRVRPMNDGEKSNRAHCVLECPSNKELVVNERPADKLTKKFSFDRVFDAQSKQIDVYKLVARPLVDEVLNGFNCTIFAYGQTGTGKTFTMEGAQLSDLTPMEHNLSAGIIPRCVNQLFDELRIQKLEFTMRVSFLELYNEELFDLLSAQDDLTKLRLYEDCTRKGSCIIRDLEEVPVQSKADVYSFINKGSAKRQTAATLLNAHSSRSHTVFTITVHIKETTVDGDELVKTGKLHLVDLAGSECIGRSGAIDKRAREAGNINQSLLTLGRVITALVEKIPHVPYRESKLTRLLQDALGGRTKTSIIATVSPASLNLEETLSTLDYAHRAKNIQNKPEVNQKFNKKELICEYTNEIEKLRRDLLAMREKNGVYLANENYQDLISTLEQQTQEISDKIAEIRSLEKELEKVMELFQTAEKELESTNVKLTKTEKKLSQTKEILECTQNLLAQTASEKEEQEFLVSAHVKTEKEFQNQGVNLINVVQTTLTDIDKLHAKLDRKRKIETLNDDVGKAFEREFEDRISSMNFSVAAFKGYHQKNASAVLEILDEFLESAQNSCNKMSDQAKILNTSVADSFNKCYDHFKTKLEERKEKGCAVANDLIAKVEEEKQLFASFFEEFFHPFCQRISLLQLQQKEAIELEEKNMNDKIELITQLHHKWLKDQATFLTSLELGLTGLAQFPDKFAAEINKKSEFLEEKSKAHSENLRKLTEQFMVEIDAGDAMFASQLPILTQTQTKTLCQTKHCTEELLEEVSKLSLLSSKHQTDNSEQMEAAKMVLAEDSSCVLRSATHLEEEMSGLKTLIEGRSAEACITLDHLLTLGNDAKNEVSTEVVEAQSFFKHEIETICGEVNGQFTSTEQNHLRLKDQTEEAASDLKQKLIRSESELEEFLADHVDQLRESRECVQSLLEEQLAKDRATGETPVRKEYQYPRSLAATSPHEQLLMRYKSKHAAPSRIPLPVCTSDADDSGATDQDSGSSTPSSGVSGGTEMNKYVSCSSVFDQDVEIPISIRNSSSQSGEFIVPSVPTTHGIREESLSNQNFSLSRSSSTSSISSLGDSKENISVSSRRLGNTKKRDLKPSSFLTTNNDKLVNELPQTRTRKILGSHN